MTNTHDPTQLPFSDSKIEEISFKDDSVVVLLSLWDGRRAVVTFFDVWAAEAHCPVGPDIEEMFVCNETPLLERARSLTDCADEAERMKSFLFAAEGRERRLLEVIAERAEGGVV